jgi:protein arginine N-methyltransferase 1
MTPYNISDYGKMTADAHRTNAYDAALRQVIRPQSVVLDLGCGAGILSLLASRAGARRVYAIEADDAIEVAREVARANGYQDRIEFIQDLSTRVELPERVDVIVSDLHGVLPLYQQLIPSLVDARRRFLAPSGVLLPSRETLWCVPVEAPQEFSKVRAGWDGTGYGLDLKAGLERSTNTWRKARVPKGQFLAEAKPWATLDYQTLEDPNVKGTLTWTAARDGVGHGLQVWFDSVLVEGVSFSNAPWEPELIFGSAFFPWRDAVPLAAGDTISVDLAADLVGDDYIWRWNTRVAAAGKSAPLKADFRQSTLFGVSLSLRRLHQQASDYVPVLNQDGEIDRIAISLIDGKNSLEDIARHLAQRFPARFRDWHEALTRLADLSHKYGA